jgi:hypothetical protein
MIRKTLQMCDPIINSYTSYGSLFSIINDSMWPWIFSNFIQIRYAQGWRIYTFDNHHLLCSNCPSLAYYVLPQDLIISKWNKSLKDLIIESVNSDYYVFLYADRYFLSISNRFMQVHFPHEIFIFGYNLEKDLVYVADNLQHGKFIRNECTFSELEAAYWAVKQQYSFLTDVRLFKPKNDITPSFDLDQVLISLDNYIHSKRTIDLLNEQKCDFGFNALNRLLEDLNNRLKVTGSLDIRPFHFLYEHKLLMEMRVKYMTQNGYLKDKDNLIINFSKLKDEFLILRNTVIKYNFTQDIKILYNIIHKFEQNITIEKNLIENLMQRLI